jgi:single-strand DNA-binding protein
MNLVVLRGVLARPASEVELPSGSRLLSLEVTVRRAEAPTETVPVSWADPPAWASVLDTGTEVVILGRVRRRFFRAGGVTQSRTEVVAARMVRSSARSKVAALLREAAEMLSEETGAGARAG